MKLLGHLYGITCHPGREFLQQSWPHYTRERYDIDFGRAGALQRRGTEADRHTGGKDVVDHQHPGAASTVRHPLTNSERASHIAPAGGGAQPAL